MADPETASSVAGLGRIALAALPSHHLQLEVLQRPIESTQYLRIRYTERLAEAEEAFFKAQEAPEALLRLN
jgi:hypothetical protein